MLLQFGSVFRSYLEIIMGDETAYYSYHNKHTNMTQIVEHFVVNGGKCAGDGPNRHINYWHS